MKRTSNTRATAGFTLVELMIALVISGLVISTMYAVASASSRHFQVQHQAANMQTALRFAMIQVKRDLMRAGFQATPRASLDECMPTANSTSIMFGGDGWVGAISSFRNDIIPSVVDVTGTNAINGFTADEITLLGNYATSNEYPGITLQAGGGQLTLDVNPLSTWHSLQQDFGWSSVTGAATSTIDVGLVQEAFPAGGMIRIQTPTGRRHYATLVVAAQVVGTTIQLNFVPAMPNSCIADANGGWVAPLQYVRYGAIGSTPGAANADAERSTDGSIAQLVRTIRQANNKNLPVVNSVQRVVLDYLAAFNLTFTLTQATGLGQPDRYTVGAGPDTTNVENTINQNPELVRAITVTLAVRAPSADPGMRFYNCANLRCMQINPPAGGGEPAARVRSLRSEIFLPNIAFEGYR